MRILLVHQYFMEEDDGGGSRWSEMIRMWEEQGHQVEVLAGMIHYTKSHKRKEYKGKFYKKKIQGQTIVWRTHVSEGQNSSFIGRIWSYFSFVFSSVSVGVFSIRGRFDVIVSTSPPLFVGLTALILSKIKGVPYVFEVRDLWPESAIDTGVLRNKWVIKLAYWLEKVIYKNARLICVLTPAFRQRLIEGKRISPDKLIYIPNGADFELSEKYLNEFDRDAFREQLGVRSSFVVIYVGAFGLANHLDQVLDAADLLRETKVMFLLIGDGMEKKRLIERTRKLDLKNVMILNSVPKREIFKYILAADVGTSVLKKVDAFKTVYSNKTFDYMSCKKPVLMAIDGVSRELIERAGAGVYVEPENPEDFAKKILLYLNEPERTAVEGEAGYKFVHKEFNRTTLAISYLRSIQSVIYEKKAFH